MRDVDGRVVAACTAAGYRAAAALPERWLGARSAMEWPRIGIYNIDDGLRYRLKVSPVVRRVRSLRAARGRPDPPPRPTSVHA